MGGGCPVTAKMPPPKRAAAVSATVGWSDYLTRYRRSPCSLRIDSTVSFIFFETVPEIKPRIVWFLCRHRHKKHYADVQIMPTCVGNPAFGAGIAAMESA